MANKHEITLAQAIDMTKSYRNNKSQDSPICETFDAESVRTLLSTTDCNSLRIYYGLNPQNQLSLVLVAVNQDDEDILPDLNSSDVLILEDGFRCPPICPPPSKLNE